MPRSTKKKLSWETPQYEANKFQQRMPLQLRHWDGVGDKRYHDLKFLGWVLNDLLSQIRVKNNDILILRQRYFDALFKISKLHKEIKKYKKKPALQQQQQYFLAPTQTKKERQARFLGIHRFPGIQVLPTEDEHGLFYKGTEEKLSQTFQYDPNNFQPANLRKIAEEDFKRMPPQLRNWDGVGDEIDHALKMMVWRMKDYLSVIKVLNNDMLILRQRNIDAEFEISKLRDEIKKYKKKQQFQQQSQQQFQY